MDRIEREEGWGPKEDADNRSIVLHFFVWGLPLCFDGEDEKPNEVSKLSQQSALSVVISQGKHNWANTTILRIV